MLEMNDLPIGRFDREELDQDIDVKPTQMPDYGKGKINQLFDSIFGGWSPKKFYIEKIKEPIKAKAAEWSPSKFYNEKIKDKVKQSELYKIQYFSDFNH